jgi:hypothetical protein
MTFKQHLERAMKEREQIKNRRQTVGQARQVLLPLSNSEQIRHLVREICADGSNRHVE